MINVLFVIVALAVMVLTCVVLYLVYEYRKLLEKYHEMLTSENKSRIRQSIREKSERFVDTKVDSAIEKATVLAVDLIDRAARNAANAIKKQSLEKLIEEEVGEEKATAARFDEANEDIEKFKAEKIEEARKKINDILGQAAREATGDLFDQTAQEKAVTKALENAKRSNLF